MFNFNKTPVPRALKKVLLGQRVHCILYGGKDGVVVDIHGEQTLATIQRLGGFGVSGGSASFDIIWDNGSTSHKIPEALLQASVQWRIYDEVWNESQRAEAQRNRIRFDADKQAQAAAAKAAYEFERAKALADYPHLKQKSEHDCGGTFAAKNIRAELKRHWPKVKFSVTSTYDAVRVKWTDGPTSGQVEPVVQLFDYGRFDSNQDLMEYVPTAFTDLFGGSKYQSITRMTSDRLLAKAIEALYLRLPSNLSSIPLKDALQETSQSYSKAIPGMDHLSIREAARLIAYFWDDLRGCYVDSSDRYARDKWLVWDSNGECKCTALT